MVKADEIRVTGVVVQATAPGFFVSRWNGHDHAEHLYTDVWRYGGSNGGFGEETMCGAEMREGQGVVARTNEDPAAGAQSGYSTCNRRGAGSAVWRRQWRVAAVLDFTLFAEKNEPGSADTLGTDAEP